MPVLYFLLVVLGVAALTSRRSAALTQISGRASRPSATKLLHHCLSKGHAPDRYLVNEAMREAFERGDWKTVARLSRAFPDDAFQTQGVTPSDMKSGEEVIVPQPSIVIGKNSPLEGVSNEEWSSFVDKMRFEPSPDDSYVGPFVHNKERLSQLGIDPTSLTSDDAHVDALGRDLSAYNEAERKLINDACGDVLTIDGNEYPVTLSGVLAVLKAAGPSGARSWFKSEGDRARFPRTTETFKRANGVF